MPIQAIRSEVKFKVRQNALLLREFTIAQLVRATGLNPESVRTEVQRLRREGMVTSERKPGRREALYRLSDDPEKRLALSRSVEAFYPEPREPVPPRPTSRLYQAALQSLDQAEREKGRRREELLAQAAHQLEGAWQAEGASRAPELVQAHFLRERGRLACFQGRREQAQGLFNQAREKFATAGLESETRLVDEYLLYIEARRWIDANEAVDPAAQARCVLEVLEAAEHPPIGPLARLFADLIRSQTTEHRVVELVYRSVAAVSTIKEVADEMRELRAELGRERIGDGAAWQRLTEQERSLMQLDVAPWPSELYVESQMEPTFGFPRRRPRRRGTDD